MNDCLRKLLIPSLLIASNFALCAAALLACNKSDGESSEAKPSAPASGSAAPTRPKAADEDLAAAVEQAARELNAPIGENNAAAENGPPPNGVLGPARAQSEAVLGSTPKLTLATNGSEPRLKLGGAPIAEKQPGQIEVAVRTGPRAALPTVLLRLEAGKPKAASTGASTDSTATSAAAGDAFTLTVVSAGLGKSQPGEIPPSTEELIKKLKGSTFSATLKADALVGGMKVERAKGVGEQLDLLLSAAADALTAVVTHVPTEPVGQGATWLVSSRETFLGTDVVAYRMFKVEEMTPDGALVSVNTKRYAAGGALGLPGIVDNQIDEFQSTDEARFRMLPGQRLPVEGQLMQRLGAVISSGGNQEPVQIESRGLFAFPPPPKPGAVAP